MKFKRLSFKKCPGQLSFNLWNHCWFQKCSI